MRRPRCGRLWKALGGSINDFADGRTLRHALLDLIHSYPLLAGLLCVHGVRALGDGRPGMNQVGLRFWFRERFGGGGKRLRRIGIVVVARKLLIALWRFLKTGVIPEGAVLKEA